MRQDVRTRFTERETGALVHNYGSTGLSLTAHTGWSYQATEPLQGELFSRCIN